MWCSMTKKNSYLYIGILTHCSIPSPHASSPRPRFPNFSLVNLCHPILGEVVGDGFPNLGLPAGRKALHHLVPHIDGVPQKEHLLQTDAGHEYVPEKFVGPLEHGKHEIHGREKDAGVKTGHLPQPPFEIVDDNVESPVAAPVGQPEGVVVAISGGDRHERGKEGVHGADGRHHEAFQNRGQEEEENPHQPQVRRVDEGHDDRVQPSAHLLRHRLDDRRQERAGDVIEEEGRAVREGEPEPHEEEHLDLVEMELDRFAREAVVVEVRSHEEYCPHGHPVLQP
mmetsp:Transcript_57119/g.170242  ORF Transcript_57119/g.170242 Transcript_57119/m.170242 type:complete len:282 (+) Transcript_57119:466-1311(+)